MIFVATSMLILALTAGEGEVYIPDINLQPEIRQVSVPVKVENVKGVMGIWMEIDFDPTMLEATEILLSDATKGMISSTNILKGRVIVAMAGVNPIDLDGELFRIKFRLTDKMKEGTTTRLRITKADFNEGAIEVKIKEGRITSGKPSAVTPKHKRIITWAEMKKAG
ncbi:TPA: hypothetical protein EYP37_00355 [Candidatus Poribacteria bacterium]|nr:hypothetical protein [Candidatus Poribacteria bacterium]